MTDDDRQVLANRQHPIIGVAILCDVLRELDIDPGPVLAESGIDPAIVRDPGATVKAAQELAFIRRAGIVSDVGDLGLRAATRAITLDPSLRARACRDSDFDALRATPDGAALIRCE